MAKRTSNQQSLKDVIEDFYNQSSILREGHIRHKILAHWKELVGEHICKSTNDVWYQNKKLYVYLNSSVLRNELSFHKQELKDKINLHFDAEYVQEIILK